MTDPVSDLLAQRLNLPWRWRSAVGVALAIHVAVALAISLSGRTSRRAVSLPHISVRIAALPVPVRSSQPSSATPAVSRQASTPAKAAPKPKVERAEPRPAKRAAKPVATARPEPAAAASGPPTTGANSQAPAPPGQTTAPGGANLGLAGGSGGVDEPFPYDYYLQRVLATIEANWFRPPVPATTRAQVLCRIDRSGRLVETGIETSSDIPAFDRAALRAVYAAAPLPPLPQAYPGKVLTLHLEFRGQ